MATKVDRYREALRGLSGSAAWERFLLEESCLPGPRANLELVAAAIEEGDKSLFLSLLEEAPPEERSTADQAADPRREFLAVCGAAGLGRMVAEGDRSVLPTLREAAGDPRWRVREAVAMGLQRWGDDDLPGLLQAAAEWARGTRYEQRAAVAGLCEPRLLCSAEVSRRVLRLLDEVTATLVAAADRRDEGFRALRKALGYGWSVAVVAEPEAGLPLLDRWLQTDDPDVRWVLKQNLGKARLVRAAPEWVAARRERV